MKFNGLTKEEFYGEEMLNHLEDTMNSAMIDLSKKIDDKAFKEVFQVFYKYLFTDCDESDVLKEMKNFYEIFGN